ncbi:MAG: chromate transporter [Clostridia bacterium]|nr:chromate transporter [Clostridia bacterium]
MKKIFSVFLAFFKIGLITFGGGYAMIAVIERELVERKKWITHEEFLDIIAIAESSPGPIAINSATFIGHKVCGFLGSLFATLGVVLPSFTIIFIISLFFDKFLSLEYVGYAFRGIQSAVAFLILSAGIKMFKNIKRNLFNIIMFTLTLCGMLILEFFAPNFSTVFIILIGGVIGVFAYAFRVVTKKIKTKSTDIQNVSETETPINSEENTVNSKKEKT